MKKYHVKKGDKVVVNTGVFKGEEATVTAILSKKDRVAKCLLKYISITMEQKLRFGTILICLSLCMSRR